MHIKPTPNDGCSDDREQIAEKSENGGAELTTPPAEGHPVDENEPTSVEKNTKSSEDVTPEKADIFDDLTALGRPIDQIVPSEKVMTALHLRKPKKDDWVQLHPEIRTWVYLYEDKSEGSWYIVLPGVVEPLLDIAYYTQLNLAVTYGGSPFIWPVKVPAERKPHQAHVSAFAAAEKAQKEWIRIAWGGNDYNVYRRRSATVDPVWPMEISNPTEMLRFAEKSGAFEVIDSPDHPVIRRHLGLD